MKLPAVAIAAALLAASHVFSPAIISLLSWTLLGFLAACFAEQPRPANHVMSLLEQKRLSLVHLLTDGQQIEIHCFVACLAADKTASALAKVPNQK
jgi:hypothetical protein